MSQKNNHLALITNFTVFKINAIRNDFINLLDSMFDEIESIHGSDIKEVTKREKIKLDMLHRINESLSKVNKELSSIRTKLQKQQDSTSKGGSYSPYKNNENEIIALINQYRQSQLSLGNKQTHQELAEVIAIKVNKQVNISTVKKWWGNYKKVMAQRSLKKIITSFYF